MQVRPSDKYNDEVTSTTSGSVNRSSKNDICSRIPGHCAYHKGFSSGTLVNETSFINDNMNISDYMLDNTLLRIFSRNCNENGNSNIRHRTRSRLGFSYSDFVDTEPVLWRLHPMSEIHRETLDREIDFLSLHVKPHQIIHQLYRDGVLTSMDYNQLTRMEGQGDRAVTRLLIKTLQRRGEKAYPSLTNALLGSNYAFVCERLADSDMHLMHSAQAGRSETKWWTPFRIDATWPLAKQRGMQNHMTPQYRSSPPNHMIPDVHITDANIRERVEDLDARLRTLEENIISLRDAAQSFSPNRMRSQHLLQSPRTKPQVRNGGGVIDASFLEQELTTLRVKLAQVLEYVAALKPERFNAKSANVEPVTAIRESCSSSVGDKVTSPTRLVIYHPHLEDQVNDLQNKLKELHDDMLIFKMATFSNSHTETPFKNSQKETLRDSLHKFGSNLSTTKQAQSVNTARQSNDFPHSNVIQESMFQSPYTRSHTRYPSRYSHVDGLKTHKLNIARSPSRSNRMFHIQQESKKSDCTKFYVKHGNKNSETTDKSSVRELSDRYHSTENDMAYVNKIYKTKSCSHFSSEKSYSSDEKSSIRKNDKLYFNEQKFFIHKDNENFIYDAANKKSQKSSEVQSRTDRKIVSPAEMFDDEKTTIKIHTSKVPIIITPAEKPAAVPQFRMADKSTLDAAHEEPDPKEIKNVSYTMKWDKIREQTSDTESPVLTEVKLKYSNRDHHHLLKEMSLQQLSPVESARSEHNEQYRVTTPTRILSPPHGISHKRLTTPYQILRDPNDRTMTTWSMSR